MDIPLSIVITTYNRESELRRCIDSIMLQNYSNVEIIIVDDHSTDNYRQKIINDYPNVKYFYQEVNLGPGNARNKGIEVAKNNYIVIMDDDDIFHNNAFKRINYFLMNNTEFNYPVLKFLRSNAKLSYNENYKVNSFKEILRGSVQGDTVPIINKKIFWGKEGYRFPNSRIGAESLLWYRIAIDYGYPVRNEIIVELIEDSNDRLTNTDYQIKRANLFKEYQLDIIDNFETEIIKQNELSFLIQRYRGVITYALLEGDRFLALKYIFKSLNYSIKQAVFFPLIIMPKFLVKRLFLKYRS